MMTLISTVISFLMGGVPKILDFMQDRSDKKHEIQLAQMQIAQQLELQKAGYQSQERIEAIHLDELKVDADVKSQEFALKEHEALLAHDTASAVGASQWVVNARAMVRPSITYGMFLLLAFVDIFGFFYAVKTNVPFDLALNLLWDDDSQQIFASIVAFYFGGQAFKK
jgi:hypothetical protein